MYPRIKGITASIGERQHLVSPVKSPGMMHDAGPVRHLMSTRLLEHMSRIAVIVKELWHKKRSPSQGLTSIITRICHHLTTQLPFLCSSSAPSPAVRAAACAPALPCDIPYTRQLPWQPAQPHALHPSARFVISNQGAQPEGGGHRALLDDMRLIRLGT